MYNKRDTYHQEILPKPIHNDNTLTGDIKKHLIVLSGRVFYRQYGDTYFTGLPRNIPANRYNHNISGIRRGKTVYSRIITMIIYRKALTQLPEIKYLLLLIDNARVKSGVT